MNKPGNHLNDFGAVRRCVMISDSAVFELRHAIRTSLLSKACLPVLFRCVLKVGGMQMNWKSTFSAVWVHSPVRVDQFGAFPFYPYGCCQRQLISSASIDNSIQQFTGTKPRYFNVSFNFTERLLNLC